MFLETENVESHGAGLQKKCENFHSILGLKMADDEDSQSLVIRRR